MIDRDKFLEMFDKSNSGLEIFRYDNARALREGVGDFLREDLGIYVAHGDRSFSGSDLTNIDLLYPLTRQDKAKVGCFLDLVDGAVDIQKRKGAEVEDGRVFLEHLNGRLHYDNHGQHVMSFDLGNRPSWGIEFKTSFEKGGNYSVKVIRSFSEIDRLGEKIFELR